MRNQGFIWKIEKWVRTTREICHDSYVIRKNISVNDMSPIKQSTAPLERIFPAHLHWSIAEYSFKRKRLIMVRYIWHMWVVTNLPELRRGIPRVLMSQFREICHDSHASDVPDHYESFPFEAILGNTPLRSNYSFLGNHMSKLFIYW